MNAIDTVFAKNGAPVTAGDTLLVFRSEVDWRPVKALDHWLTTIPYPAVTASTVSMTLEDPIIKPVLITKPRE
jgi:hypothetical protein